MSNACTAEQVLYVKSLINRQQDSIRLSTPKDASIAAVLLLSASRDLWRTIRKTAQRDVTTTVETLPNKHIVATTYFHGVLCVEYFVHTTLVGTVTDPEDPLLHPAHTSIRETLLSAYHAASAAL